MRKIFFCFNLVISLFLSASVLGCKGLINPNLQNQIEFALPEWPPHSLSGQLYPQLSRWEIRISDSNQNFRKFYIASDKSILKISRKLLKNAKSFSILANPIIYDSFKNEVDFYKPAGLIYPLHKDSEINWERGYISKIYENLVLNSSPSGELQSLICSFNWKKLDELIENKIKTSRENFIINQDNPKIFNPWYKNPTAIAKAIYNKSFSASLLNLSNTFSVPTDLVPDKINLQSSYIPENEMIQKFGYFCLSQDEVNIFFINDNILNSCVIIKGTNEEKISVKVINVPIYIE